MAARLTLLVCTLNDRILHVPALLLPQREDVEYVVSFQYTAEMFYHMIPEELYSRSDVHLFPILGSGISANRNNALRHCETELALLADDDARYTDAQLTGVIHYFQSHPDTDIACFQVIDQGGTPLKDYVKQEFDYAHRPSGSYFSSLEIVFRTDAPIPAFDTRFGLGADYLSCGEEEVFLHLAYRQGARIQYVPQILCTIPTIETTGARFAFDKRVRRSKGAVLYMMHGYIGALLRITRQALTLRPWKFARQAWWDMYDGIHYLLHHPLNEGVANEIPLDFQPIETWKIP